MSDFETKDDVCVSLPSSPADRQKLKTMISEATYCLQRIDDEKAAVKDIIDVIHTDYGLSKKHVRRLINTLYKQNYTDRVAEEEEFELLYEGLFQAKVDKKAQADELRAFLAEETHVTHEDGDEPEDLPFDV